MAVDASGNPISTDVGSPAASTVPDDYEQLRAFRDQMQPVIERLSPYGDDIQWLTENDDHVKLIRDTRKFYEDGKKQREPELDPVAKQVLDRLAPTLDYVTSARTAQEKAEQARVQADQRRVRTEADALTTKYPWLKENNGAALHAIARYGDELGLTSMDEAYRRFTEAGSPRGTTPPKSLRSEAGGGGVPGPSTSGPIKGRADFRARIKHAFATGGK